MSPLDWPRSKMRAVFEGLLPEWEAPEFTAPVQLPSLAEAQAQYYRIYPEVN